VIGYLVDLGYGEKMEMEKQFDAKLFSHFKYVGDKTIGDKIIYSYYNTYFEEELLRKTILFYTNKGVNWL
jgi:hypothetical protein